MKDKATEIFKQLKSKLVINCYKYSEIEENPSVSFTYQNEMKSWSHSVELAYNDNGIYLYSSRMLKKEELKENLFKEYNENEAMYKIKIENTSEAIDFLRKHDNFKYKF